MAKEVKGSCTSGAGRVGVLLHLMWVGIAPTEHSQGAPRIWASADLGSILLASSRLRPGDPQSLLGGAQYSWICQGEA